MAKSTQTTNSSFMHQSTLPGVLRLALQKHAAQDDINDDEELRQIMCDLTVLHEKIEALKCKARLKKTAKHS